MHITLRQLQVFEAAARLGGYTRAAESLYMTQPAVSMQIRQLEEQAGMPLFDQIGKKIHLTDAGRALYRHAQSILEKVTEARLELEEMRGVRRGQLDITIASTANYFAPRLIAAFCQRHPEVKVTLNVSNREHILARLADSEKDLAIMGRPPEESNLVAHPFLANPLVVIAAPTHPLAGKRHLSLARVAAEPFITREPGSGTRMAAERHFSEQGVTFEAAMEMSSNEAIKQAVQAGLGLGVVSIHTLEMELALDRLAVLDVAGFPLQRYWYAVHRQGKRFSAVAQSFLDFVMDEAERIVVTPVGPPPG
ncbi:MAG: LysR family transcriptional regulator [Hydrogenophilales bacterium 16-64-46]|nr:MAG: LysR family transcriptional regulator [Hydrogenophilales bacterium 12-64-13]OYZ05233.1 MAG: LysR family transcriptional regulator [Hydrogenophilales bacterium 16-64-46]OZA37048.1 MAG: LysR family transcriptional regulator [Hydrogenophilales bacterium 17-64-34]HQS99936.1 LysR family transcriptional regulator [Thiobacillus sp.]